MERFKKLLMRIDMTEGTPWKKLAIFAVPMIIGNIFQQLYSISDAIILGRFIGDYALAAIGSSMPLFFLIIVIMMGVSMGVSIMVSQYFGAKDRDGISYTVGNGITLVALIGVVMMAVGPFLSRPLLVLLGTPVEILDDSVMYMNILLIGILGMAYFNILSGVLRGLGDSFSPLVYLIVSNILNIAFNFLFIAVLGWGMPSVAVGTVLAQGLSSLLCLSRLMKMQDTFDMGLKYLRPKKEYVKKIMKLGVPSGVSQGIIAIGIMIVQPLVNSFGPMVIATNVIVMRIDGLVMMPIFSFSNAMTIYTGQNMGAGKIDRISKGTKQGAILAVTVCAALVAIILIFGRFIAEAFTTTEEVIDLSQQLLRILAPGFLALTLAMVLWGTIRGAGDAIYPMWAAIINTIVIRIPSAYLFVHFLGRPEAIMFSMITAWTVNMIFSIVVYRMGKWKTKGIINNAKNDS
ncbi:MAG: MATE family efflux transporter [Oscillospiraceae bacterium]|nr:MATE family efflux transporter [Oscillospiraceae bacterium]